MIADVQITTDTMMRFGLKTLGVFALIFLAAVLTPRIAKYVDEWKEKHKSPVIKHQRKSYRIRSIYELPPDPEQEPKKVHVRKKKK